VIEYINWSFLLIFDRYLFFILIINCDCFIIWIINLLKRLILLLIHLLSFDQPEKYYLNMDQLHFLPELQFSFDQLKNEN
jgi:hypothetical protein